MSITRGDCLITALQHCKTIERLEEIHIELVERFEDDIISDFAFEYIDKLIEEKRNNLGGKNYAIS